MAAGSIPRTSSRPASSACIMRSPAHFGGHHGLPGSEDARPGVRSRAHFQAAYPERAFGAAGQNPRGGALRKVRDFQNHLRGRWNRAQSPVDGVETRPVQPEGVEPRSISSSHPRAYPSARFTSLCRDGASVPARESNHSRAAVRNVVQVCDTRRRQPLSTTQPHLHGNRADGRGDLRDDETCRGTGRVRAKSLTRFRTVSLPDSPGVDQSSTFCAESGRLR